MTLCRLYGEKNVSSPANSNLFEYSPFCNLLNPGNRTALNFQGEVPAREKSWTAYGKRAAAQSPE